MNWEDIEYVLATHENHLHGDICERLMLTICDLCICGSGDDALLLIEVLEWCALEHDEKGREGTYRNVSWELAAKILDSAGLIEHGNGIGWPWVTSDGDRILEILRNVKDDNRNREANSPAAEG